MYLTSMHCHVKSLAGHTQFFAKSVPKETLILHILSELIFHSFCSSCYQEQKQHKYIKLLILKMDGILVCI